MVEKPLPVSHEPISEYIENRDTESAASNVEQAKAIKRIYGDEILDLFTIPHNEKATSLFYGLLNYIFDPGTNRDVSCTINVNGQNEELHEKPVPIHSRSSLIAYSMEKIQKGQSVEFGMIDLQNLRGADFDLGELDKGIHSADIILNKTVSSIRRALKQSWGEYGFDIKEQSYELGRYGGDEFVIALFGDKAIAKKQEIVNKVKEEISNEKGYYKKGEVIEKLPIELKKNEDGSFVDWMRLPHDEMERMIYLEYFQRGLLLSDQDFDRVKEKYSVNGLFSIELYRNDYPEKDGVIVYPKGIKDDVQKRIQYVVKNHPELNPYFALAEKFDNENSLLKNETSRQEGLLGIIESSIFDRLLGDLVYSKSHFKEGIRREMIDKICVVDFKFLKEINTAMTYADADLNLKKLWDYIQSTFSDEDRKKVVTSRFGGAFYIGLRKGERLSNEEALCAIRSMEVVGSKDKTSHTVPLGFSQKEITSSETKYTDKMVRDMERESDKNFYRGLFGDILYSSIQSPAFLDSITTADIEGLKKREGGYRPLTKAELYALHLKGKRKEARVQKIKQELNEVYVDVFSALRDNYSLLGRVQLIQQMDEIKGKLIKDLNNSLLAQ